MMNWQQVCEHPSLRNLPFKIELNERGEIIMSPTKVYHSAYLGEIGSLLWSMRREGQVLTECAIKTSKGTKVADVAWASAERFRRIKHEAECSIAPEVCVEVVSPSNTADDIKEKRDLYLEACHYPNFFIFAWPDEVVLPVPEGLMKIAQQFIAGTRGQESQPSPGGTAESW
jgi:Uma2 family endonuclease